jgi:hypothetical protein
MDGTPGHNLSYVTLEGRFPYGSPKDTEHHQLHLCEACYDWLRAFLKENGVEIDVADGNIWSGLSRLDVPRFPVNLARHGYDRTTENQDLCGNWTCLCGHVFESNKAIKEHFSSVGFYL